MESLMDDDENITRFLVLAREPIIPGTNRPHKTSIVFSLEEGPGYNDVHKQPDVDMNKLNDGGKYTQSLKMTKTTTTCPIRRR
ncbi:hypothetical protein GYH30_052125 [Glycine max]|nr:hypothetical protein JHK87_052504 [Glycine soja]KAH1076497.1 hypothetical protein GYH30_052125 [Glycine max]